MPGFVDFPHKFPHARHVQVGLECEACHGAVQTRAVMEQAAPLTMGWRVACHANPPSGIRQRGPLDCAVCHH